MSQPRELHGEGCDIFATKGLLRDGGLAMLLQLTKWRIDTLSPWFQHQILMSWWFLFDFHELDVTPICLPFQPLPPNNALFKERRSPALNEDLISLKLPLEWRMRTCFPHINYIHGLSSWSFSFYLVLHFIFLIKMPRNPWLKRPCGLGVSHLLGEYLKSLPISNTDYSVGSDNWGTHRKCSATK